jgi:hypothetical protein
VQFTCGVGIHRLPQQAHQPVAAPLLRRRGSGSFQVPGSGPDAAEVSRM